MKTRNSDNNTTQSSTRVNNETINNKIVEEHVELLRTDRPPEADVAFITELISDAQHNFIHLLKQRQKRQNAIDYHNNALAQGLLPNNIRLELHPYKWPASFNVEENRENHKREVKILNTALKEIANNRLNILTISLQQIKEEINKNNEECFILDEIIKSRPITDKFMTYYKELDTQYNMFTNDNITTTIHINTQVTSDDSDTESIQNNNIRTTTNSNNKISKATIAVDLTEANPDKSNNKVNKKKKMNNNITQNNTEIITTNTNKIPNDNNLDARLNTIVTVIETLASVLSNNNNNNNNNNNTYKRNNQSYNNNNYNNNNKNRYNNRSNNDYNSNEYNNYINNNTHNNELSNARNNNINNFNQQRHNNNQQYYNNEINNNNNHFSTQQAVQHGYYNNEIYNNNQYNNNNGQNEEKYQMQKQHHNSNINNNEVNNQRVNIVAPGIQYNPHTY